MVESTVIDVDRGMRRLIGCLGEIDGLQALIVTDPFSTPELVDAAERELSTRGANSTRVTIECERHMSDTEPSEEVAVAMERADIVVEIMTVSVRHSSARGRAQLAGTRYLYLGNPPLETFTGAGAMYTDFAQHRNGIEKMARLVDDGTEMRITTELGTDLVIDLSGRSGRALTGMADSPGLFGTPPGLEWGLVPGPTGVTGRLVADAWAVSLGLLSEPLTADFVDGRIVRIDDSVDGRRLERLLASAGNDAAYQACEIGIGANPDAQMIDDMMSAEAVLGTAHVAVGTTPADPGVERIDAGMHIDLVFWHPTIWIDGTRVMVNGEIDGDHVAESQ